MNKQLSSQQNNWLQNEGYQEEYQQQNNQKKTIVVYMNNSFDPKTLNLRQVQLRNLAKLKKKLLNQYGLQQSQGKKIDLSIIQAYPTQPQHIRTPILNDQTLKLLIIFLKTYNRPIRIWITPNQQYGPLQNKQILSAQAIQKGQVHFDQNGSVIEQKDEMNHCIPSDQKFDNSKGHVRCQFCQKNNQNIEYLKKCGGLYGPFGQQKYVHLLCAIWCHAVFLNKDGYLQNVGDQIKRAAKIQCNVCKEKGAGLVCMGYRTSKKGKTKFKCTKRYHFKCAYNLQCQMNWVTYKMLCPACSDQLQQIMPKQIQSSNQMQLQSQIQQSQINQKQYLIVKQEQKGGHASNMI